jgi:hypothetical protein
LPPARRLRAGSGATRSGREPGRVGELCRDLCRRLLTITPRPLAISADDRTRRYGEVNPALTYRIGGSGLDNGDGLTGALATGATTSSNAGLYAIQQGSLAASANYAVSYTPGTLAIAGALPAPASGNGSSVVRDGFATEILPRDDTATLNSGVEGLFPASTAASAVCPKGQSCGASLADAR